jgi:euchromatic histone-lysine N-methyltransferase
VLLMTGIKVGHQFYARAEMVVVGFHSHWLNGIDYMGQSYSKGVIYSCCSLVRDV